ncbi:MAG: DUF2116 family Zn-ribbon domain-containing protein [Caldilineales bacterium]
MPDCPNCGTWNPDDKTVCWRCQTEMPKPQQKKERKQMRILGLPWWMFLAVIFFIVMILANRWLTSAIAQLGG